MAVDLIQRAQARIQALRFHLARVHRAEEAEKKSGYRDLEVWTAGMARERLAEFMYRTCGFPKPEPVKVDHDRIMRQAQDDYNAVIRSIPLPFIPK